MQAGVGFNISIVVARRTLLLFIHPLTRSWSLAAVPGTTTASEREESLPAMYLQQRT